MPNPQAKAIAISERPKNLLAQIAHRTTNPYRLVRRAQLILFAAEGVNNSKISQQLQLHRNQVRLWRQRWQEAQESLTAAEAQGSNDAALTRRIIGVLSDEYRGGSKSKFSVEQIVQIVALAWEDPGQCERPVRNWTPKELADEAVKRGIVEQISPRSVGRFLKRGYPQTPSQQLLAMGPILMTPLLLENSSARSVNCTGLHLSYSTKEFM